MDNEKKENNLNNEIGKDSNLDAVEVNEESNESHDEMIGSEFEEKNNSNCEELKNNEESELSDESECEPEFQIRILENRLKEQEDSYLRLNAEYTNYRRRTSEEKTSIGLFANEKLMNELIPVIDNMERALESFEDKESSMYKGVDLVYKQMISSLEKAGLEYINAESGLDFDPNVHMAVLQEESVEFEPGKIIMELQKGYKLGKKVLRASMVKVSC